MAVLRTPLRSSVDSCLKEMERYDWEGLTEFDESYSLYTIPDPELAWVVQTILERVKGDMEFNVYRGP